MKKLIIEQLKNYKSVSCWDKGVNKYALELIEDLFDNYPDFEYECREDLKVKLLNGADDFHQFSWGGCSLIYDFEICERLATPSEKKRTKNGDKHPNANEHWLDVQARALFQAFLRIKNAFLKVQYNKIKELVNDEK